MANCYGGNRIQNITRILELFEAAEENYPDDAAVESFVFRYTRALADFTIQMRVMHYAVVSPFNGSWNYTLASVSSYKTSDNFTTLASIFLWENWASIMIYLNYKLNSNYLNKTGFSYTVVIWNVIHLIHVLKYNKIMSDGECKCPTQGLFTSDIMSDVLKKFSRTLNIAFNISCSSDVFLKKKCARY